MEIEFNDPNNQLKLLETLLEGEKLLEVYPDMKSEKGKYLRDLFSRLGLETEPEPEK